MKEVVESRRAPPPYPPTKEQFEAELLDRLDFARIQYEKLQKSAMQSAASWDEIPADALGNADATLALRKVRAQALESNRALVEYREALKEFTDFVVDGKMPQHAPKLNPK